jgi:hypothetical protein
MSEQPGAFLTMKNSYKFGRAGELRKTRSINPEDFQRWTKQCMYTTTYGEYHSKVLHLLFRHLTSLKMRPFRDIQVTFLQLELTVSMVKDLQRSPKKVSARTSCQKILSV